MPESSPGASVPRRGGRAADDEGRRQQQAAGRRSRLGDAADQELGRFAAHLVLEIPDRRQGRIPLRRFLDVVAADDREIDAGLAPAMAQSEHRAEGGEIVHADGCGGRIGRVEHGLDPPRAVLARAVSGIDQARVDGQAVAGQDLAIAVIAVAARRDALVLADEGDAAVAEADQMLHRQDGAVPVVGADEIEFVRDLARELDERNAGRDQMREGFRRAAARDAQDHAVGTIFLERVEHAILPLEILAIGAEQDRAAIGRGCLLDRGEEFGEIGVGDVVEADAEDVGAVGAQRGRAAVVAVAHLAGHLLDSGARRLRHQRRAAQGQRNRRGRDRQAIGDDLQRDPATTAWSDCRRLDGRPGANGAAAGHDALLRRRKHGLATGIWSGVPSHRHVILI